MVKKLGGMYRNIRVVKGKKDLRVEWMGDDSRYFWQSDCYHNDDLQRKPHD